MLKCNFEYLVCTIACGWKWDKGDMQSIRVHCLCLRFILTLCINGKTVESRSISWYVVCEHEANRDQDISKYCLKNVFKDVANVTCYGIANKEYEKRYFYPNWTI